MRMLPRGCTPIEVLLPRGPVAMWLHTYPLSSYLLHLRHFKVFWSATPMVPLLVKMSKILAKIAAFFQVVMQSLVCTMPPPHFILTESVKCGIWCGIWGALKPASPQIYHHFWYSFLSHAKLFSGGASIGFSPWNLWSLCENSFFFKKKCCWESKHCHFCFQAHRCP